MIGSLDPSFGAGGTTSTDFGYSEAFATAIDADGKIVVAGRALTTGYKFAVARFNPDGAPDTGFGIFGQIITEDFGGGPGGAFGEAFALALQPDGKIVAAGNSQPPVVAPRHFTVARYNQDGALDPTFGTGGTVTTPIGSFSAAAGIVVQPDLKLVLAGYGNGVALARYNPDGTLDTTFGSGGTVAINTDTEARDVSLQPDGKIVVAGQNAGNGVLLRFNPDGSLDPAFGGGGRVATGFGIARGVAVLPGGNILTVGDVSVPRPPSPFAASDFIIARYRPDGSLDASFGSAGRTTTSFGTYDEAEKLVVQADGKIVVAGRTYEVIRGGTTAYQFAVARYRPSGRLDTTFGSGGKVTTDAALDRDGGAGDVAIQADGKIVVAGTGRLTGSVEFTLARYLGDPARADVGISLNAVPDPVPRGGGRLAWIVELANRGPTGASEVMVTDILPASCEFLNAIATRGNSSGPPPGAAGTILWAVGALPAGGRAALTIEVRIRAGAGSTITNSATVSSSTPDPVSANNTASVVTAVV